MKLQQRCYQNGVWNAPLPDHLDGPTTVCFTFFAPDMDIAAAVGDLKQALPQSQIIGCSGAGEIKGTLLKDHALVATVAQFERTAVKTFCQTITTSSQSFSAGISLAALIPQEGLRAIYMLSEGLTVNGTELMRGLRSTVPGSVTIAGGLAGDGTRFKSTRVLYDQVAQPGQIVAVALYGDNLIIGAHARGGWLPFGPERRITKSTDNILYALDNRPALALYKEFLGHSADGLPASALHFPLLLGAGGAPLARNIVRTILAIDEKDQSMTFAGDMPMGEIVRLMRSKKASSMPPIRAQNSAPTICPLTVRCLV